MPLYLMVWSMILLLLMQGVPAFSQDLLRDAVQIGTDQSQSDLVTLNGKVIDAQTGEAIIGATILFVADQGGTVSESDGSYVFECSPGNQLVQVSYLGYASLEIDLTIYQDGEWDIRLTKTSVQLDQVIVTDRSAQRNLQNSIAGVETLSLTALQQRSQLLGELDVLRSIQTLSGVTSAGDGASGFNVRGGNADENLILQDGALILNPTHTLGFFSLFHPDLIQSVQLYKGNQPSYYGGRLSSVLDVNLRDGDKEDWKIGGGIGLAASRLTVEGPIKKGMASVLVGGRFSYMDYLLNLVKNINVKRSKTFFYDLTAKVDARISNKTSLDISAFISEDDFQFGQEVNFNYSTKTASARLSHLFTDKWSANLSVNIGDYESALFDIQGNDQSRFSNGVGYFRGTLRSLFQVSEDLRVGGGIALEDYTVRPGTLTPEGASSSAVSETLPHERGQAWIPFAQVEWQWGDVLNLYAGIRYTAYSKKGPGEVAIYEEGQFRSELSTLSSEVFNAGDNIVIYNGLERRLGISITPGENTAIKMGYHRGFQYLSQISNTASATPIDLWKLADTHIEPQTADNYNFGIFKNFRDHTFESSVELFYRDQQNLIDYKDFPDLLLNQFIEREVVFGDGRAYGVEINFKKNTGKFKYDVNYTFSRSERKVTADATQDALNIGNWYPSNYDRPHSLNLNISQAIAEKGTLSIAFSYSTGRPVTAPISNFKTDNILNVPLFSQRNQFRIPDYHRLDIAYTIGPFTGKNRKSENRLVFSIYNLYSRKNAYSVFFRQRAFQRLSTFRIATLGSIFPSVTYNFTFS